MRERVRQYSAVAVERFEKRQSPQSAPPLKYGCADVTCLTEKPKLKIMETLRRTEGKMKLAEALILRADLQKRLAQIEDRLSNNVLYQEGDQPSEHPEEIQKELDSVLTQLEALICKINRTNQLCKDGDLTLSELIVKRDMLVRKNEIIRNCIEIASMRARRNSGSEIRLLSAVDVAKLQKQQDQLSKRIRETDMRLQSANWQTELLES